MITLIAILIALFFAMNIGASGAAASMGIAYGSGALQKRIIALLISGLGVFLGAVLGGGEVVKTLGTGIIPSEIIQVHIALIILGSAALTLFTSNLMGIPLSTSEVTVGSIVGVGIAFQSLYIKNIIVIVLIWIIIPIIASFLAIIVDRLILSIEKRYPDLTGTKWSRLLALFVISTGFLEAFSAGMNNVANSVGPLVGAGIISVNTGTVVGGLFVALGAVVLGGRVLETNGKRITELSLLQGGAVSGVGALLVIIASLLGIPVPQTQITTCSIIGIGLSRHGAMMLRKSIIVKLLKVWLVSPICSLVLSYSFVKLSLDYNFYFVFIGICLFLATIGVITLYRTTKKEKHALYTQQVEQNKL